MGMLREGLYCQSKRCVGVIGMVQVLSCKVQSVEAAVTVEGIKYVVFKLHDTCG